MIKILLRYRDFIPRIFFNLLHTHYWKGFWKKQLIEQKRVLGNTASCNLENSERASLIESIVNSYPFNNLLEIGCGLGQNFHVLCKIINQEKLSGIDLDSSLISQGEIFLKELGINNVELKALAANKLDYFKDKSFDLVVTAASLLYIPEVEIDLVVRNIIRLAKRKIILLEQNITGSNKLINTTNELPDYWLRDYNALFSKHISPDKIKIKKITNPHWRTENWQELGTIIEIELK